MALEASLTFLEILLVGLVHRGRQEPRRRQEGGQGPHCLSTSSFPEIPPQMTNKICARFPNGGPRLSPSPNFKNKNSST